MSNQHFYRKGMRVSNVSKETLENKANNIRFIKMYKFEYVFDIHEHT